MRYNLKFSVACLLLLLPGGPLLYYLLKPVTEFRVHDYRAELTACVLTLPLLLLLSFSARFARLCSKEPARAGETMATARYVSCIGAILLVLAIIGEYAL
jgi:hypothetical protein